MSNLKRSLTHQVHARHVDAQLEACLRACTCFAARLAFCALAGLLAACWAAATKLLFPALVDASAGVYTVLVPVCASLLELCALHGVQAASVLHGICLLKAVKGIHDCG